MNMEISLTENLFIVVYKLSLNNSFPQQNFCLQSLV